MLIPTSTISSYRQCLIKENTYNVSTNKMQVMKVPICTTRAVVFIYFESDTQASNMSDIS